MAGASPQPVGSVPPRRRAAVEAALLAVAVAAVALAVLLAVSPDSKGAAASGSNGAVVADSWPTTDSRTWRASSTVSPVVGTARSSI